jgi:hypothetical protein
MQARKFVLGVALLLSTARPAHGTAIVALASSEGVVLTVDGLRTDDAGAGHPVDKLHLVKSHAAVTMTGVAHAELEGLAWEFGSWVDEVGRSLAADATVADIASALGTQAGRLGPLANAIRRNGHPLPGGRLFTAVVAGVDAGRVELWQLDVLLVPGGVDARLERLSPAAGTLAMRALGANSAARQLVDGRGPAFDRISADVPAVSARLRQAQLKLPELASVGGTLVRCEADPSVGGPVTQVVIPVVGPLELREVAATCGW